MKLLRIKIPGIIMLLLIFVYSITIANAQFPSFKDGDRVCFIGNSITMGGEFHQYIQLYFATRFPDRKIQFFDCGISGDVTREVLERMESDILIHQPTWSALMIGMNDVRRSLYSKERVLEPGIKEKQQKTLTRYYGNVDSIVRILMNAGSKVILQTPSIYDQTADLKATNYLGVNDALGQCAVFLINLSYQYNLPLVNYWTVMNTINSAIQRKDPGATLIGRDRVHPHREGHFVMAVEFLKTQQVPSYVSAVSINAENHEVLNVARCTLRDIKYDGSGISFSSLETGLPFPLLAKDFNPDSLVSFTKNFNKEMLQIKSLKMGTYVLKIDSIVIGEYSESELEKGINLATNTRTPQYKQAEKVLKLLNDYWGFVQKLRQIKYTEYGLMNEEMRQTQLFNEDDNISELGKKMIEKRMERFMGQSKENVAFYRRHFDKYLVNKPMEKELQSGAKEAFKEVYQINTPVWHHYLLTKKN